MDSTVRLSDRSAVPTVAVRLWRLGDGRKETVIKASLVGHAPLTEARDSLFMSDLCADLDLVAIDMGYGHLRPAHALSDFLAGPPILLADQPPLSSETEQKIWQRARHAYEILSRAGRLPVVGGLLGDVLSGVTNIPSLYPVRDLSSRTLAVQLLEKAAQNGMGAGLASRLKAGDRTLLSTFYGPAVLSDYHGCDRLYCVVTDSDINRVWAPVSPHLGAVTYLAPTLRARRRLRAYGVAQERIITTGYPLPHELVGGPTAPLLRRNLRRRLVALDPRGAFLRECREEVSHFLGELSEGQRPVPHLVFAVGGAGAQAELASEFLPSLSHSLRRSKLKITLVAGLRPEVEESFRRTIERFSLTEELESGVVNILGCRDHASYFREFNQLLASADVLWTKPSELSFFGALGIPLLFSSPVGSHERYNRRWAISTGAGVKQGEVRLAGEWFWEMLKDGTFAGAAWSAYMRMPKFGLYRIVEEVLGKQALERALAGADLALTETETSVSGVQIHHGTSIHGTSIHGAPIHQDATQEFQERRPPSIPLSRAVGTVYGK